MTYRRAVPFLLGMLVASCGGREVAPPAPDPVETRLLEIAREYLDYGRVDDGTRWSPLDCALRPSLARFSDSNDAATHGRKIYYLFARDRDAYVAGIDKTQPIGQVIVKEAWHPVPAPKGSNGVELPRTPTGGIDVPAIPTDRGGMHVPYAKQDGRIFTTGAKSGLFIMLKQAEGWVYATVAADGSRVLQAGRIASCIGCHRDAKPDSLFGLGK